MSRKAKGKDSISTDLPAAGTKPVAGKAKGKAKAEAKGKAKAKSK